MLCIVFFQQVGQRVNDGDSGNDPNEGKIKNPIMYAHCPMVLLASEVTTFHSSVQLNHHSEEV